MNYTELHKLIDEYALKEECHCLTFKNNIVAYLNSNLIDNSTREIAYELKFTGYVNTMNYELAKKYIEERIKFIKERIIRNKKVELEQDFENEY